MPFEWYQYIGRGTTTSSWNLASKWPALSCQWYPMGDIRTHNLRTDSRIFKLSGGVDHVTRHVWPLTKVKRSKVKATRSRNEATDGRINFKLGGNCHREVRITWHTFYVSRSTRAEVEIWRTFSLSNAKIIRKRPRIAEIACPIRKSGSRNRMMMSEL